MSTLEDYLLRKSEREAQANFKARPLCLRCRKPQVTCYCPTLAKIVTSPRIVILMHPLEAKHPVGTGRMAHRCLANSQFIEGVDFTHHAGVNALINDPKLFPMILFPGPQSLDLARCSPEERQALYPKDREPVVIVLDGTWHLAKKMLHRSKNLQTLPRVCFTPSRLSRFLVRKQPHPQCFSTIEAIHELVSLLNPDLPSPAPHDQLLSIFDDFVAKQLSFRGSGPSRHHFSFLNRKAKRERKQHEYK